MSVKKEVDSLAGETLAIQAILGFVLMRLAQVPALHEAIRAGFDDAANYVEHFAISRGSAVPPEHAAKSLEIVEQLRAVAIGKHEKPRDIV